MDFTLSLKTEQPLSVLHSKLYMIMFVMISRSVCIGLGTGQLFLCLSTKEIRHKNYKR